MGEDTIRGLRASDLDFLADINQRFTTMLEQKQAPSRDCGGRYRKRSLSDIRSRNPRVQGQAREHVKECATCRAAVEKAGYK